MFTGFLSMRRFWVAVAASLSLALALPLSALANVPLTQISSDPYTNSTSQHKTQVEPDTFSFGSTIVAAQQTGRFFDGGASNICWSTTTDNGASWTNGCLPGITKFQGGTFDRVSDPSVAYDARHNVWMISSLAISEAGGVHGAAVVTSRSTDGGLTWNNPVTTATGADLDKNWIVCDNTASSPFYGNCYTQWDNHAASNRLQMSTSSDGGLTWGAAKATRGSNRGLGGQPVVLPNGTVCVPYYTGGTQIGAFRSTNGGGSWSSAVLVMNISVHTVAGSLRTSALPSAEVDAAGKVYVVVQDASFRSGSSNDIVMSTSTNCSTWTSKVRIPIDATNSGVDHFIPGIAVDRTTSGSTARLGLTYYYYPVANCTSATCLLNVGFIASSNGGTSWSAPTAVAGPMTLSWLPNTSQGRMVGDYISTSYGSDGLAHGVFMVANVPTAGGSDCQTATPNCDQATYTPSTGLTLTAGSPTVDVAEVPVEQHKLPMSAAENASDNAAFNR